MTALGKCHACFLALCVVLLYALLGTTSGEAQDSQRSIGYVLRFMPPAGVSTPSGLPTAGVSTPSGLATSKSRRPIVNIVRRTIRTGRPPKQRGAQLSRDHIVVVGLDKNGEEISRVVTIDPRLVRAETVDDQGRLISRRFYRRDVQFVVTLGDDVRIVEIKILQPRWTGSKFELDELAKVPLQ